MSMEHFGIILQDIVDGTGEIMVLVEIV